MLYLKGLQHNYRVVFKNPVDLTPCAFSRTQIHSPVRPTTLPTPPIQLTLPILRSYGIIGRKTLRSGRERKNLFDALILRSDDKRRGVNCILENLFLPPPLFENHFPPRNYLCLRGMQILNSLNWGKPFFKRKIPEFLGKKYQKNEKTWLKVSKC